WGNSYLMAWAYDRFRVAHVGGDTLAPAGSPYWYPIKTSRIAIRPTNKLLQGDWPWFGDRDINDNQSAWHNDRGRPFFPTLLGDIHVENFKWPSNPPRSSYDDGGAPNPFGDATRPGLTWW